MTKTGAFMTCCFFGHKDSPSTIKPALRAVVEDLIRSGRVDSFLVGNHGSFDSMVLSVLCDAKKEYPEITYNVVLAYMPGRKEEYGFIEPMETVYPEGLENVPLRFAISWRNDWMLKESQVVVCFVRHSMGGSSKFVEKAIKQKKEIINLADWYTF